jgi:hypothetical protein
MSAHTVGVRKKTRLKEAHFFAVDDDKILFLENVILLDANTHCCQQFCFFMFQRTLDAELSTRVALTGLNQRPWSPQVYNTKQPLRRHDGFPLFLWHAGSKREEKMPSASKRKGIIFFFLHTRRAPPI